jgi:hypothetical protein
MIEAQTATYAVAIPPAAIIDNASATATAVDTQGAQYLEVIVQLGATDIALTALKLQSSTTSGGSYADITGADFDGGTDSKGGTLALPSATDDNQTCVFRLPTSKANRFIKVVATFGDGTAGGFIAGVARLSDVGALPGTDAGISDGGVCVVA